MIATLPTRIADMVADRVGLVRVPPPVELAPFKIAMAWHERVHADVRQRFLRDELIAACA